MFEAAILTGPGVKDRPDVAAALVLFRVIYFVLPLLVALVAMAGLEIHHRRSLKRQAGCDWARGGLAGGVDLFYTLGVVWSPLIRGFGP